MIESTRIQPESLVSSSCPLSGCARHSIEADHGNEGYYNCKDKRSDGLTSLFVRTGTLGKNSMDGCELDFKTRLTAHDRGPR